MSGRVRRRARQRGAISVWFALVLVFVLGAFVALAVDVGHLWLVRSELQNAADSAALAGVRDLNGLATQYPFALSAARTYGDANQANGTYANIDPADVTLGRWDLDNRTFTPTLLPPYAVNAVRVTARRTAAKGNAIDMYFAQLLGIGSQDVTAQAVAVGGGPSSTCGFVVALPSCSIFDSLGNLNCGASLTFNSNGNNAAFTLLTLQVPNTPDLECALFCTLNALLHVQLPLFSCSCSANACRSTSTKTQIAISNGNNLSGTMVQLILSALALAPSGIDVELPVFDVAICPAGNLSNVQTVAGYVRTRISGATLAPKKSITMSIQCSGTSDTRPAQNFYGMKSTAVYLAR
ncbi:pilus assembly protein TadG-related protein [Pendulispora rubella]|uniref:Pilus assembly protein TadG-related protein n=1 Tax=Pendulispora rubella TaxID=2741070 RepID=A0ABZ2KWK0_9BACT